MNYLNPFVDAPETRRPFHFRNHWIFWPPEGSRGPFMPWDQYYRQYLQYWPTLWHLRFTTFDFWRTFDLIFSPRWIEQGLGRQGRDTTVCTRLSKRNTCDFLWQVCNERKTDIGQDFKTCNLAWIIQSAVVGIKQTNLWTSKCYLTRHHVGNNEKVP